MLLANVVRALPGRDGGWDLGRTLDELAPHVAERLIAFLFVTLPRQGDAPPTRAEEHVARAA